MGDSNFSKYGLMNWIIRILIENAKDMFSNIASKSHHVLFASFERDIQSSKDKTNYATENGRVMKNFFLINFTLTHK